MSDELKPCPGRCGMPLEVVGYDDSPEFPGYKPVWFVECPCGWSGPSAETREDAVAKWGHRPGEEAAYAECQADLVAWFRGAGPEWADVIQSIEQGRHVGIRSKRIAQRVPGRGRDEGLG